MFSSTLCKAAAVASLFAITSASPFSKLLQRQNVSIPPSQDPFYVAPTGFESSAPGTILGSRPVPSPLGAFDFLPPLNLAAAYQLLYRTNDALGNPLATVLSVLVPYNANMSRVISYQDFEDSACPDCATSYAIQQSSSSETSLSKIGLIFQGGVLSNGWVLIYPDYEGPQAALSGISSGQATLDGIRAMLSSQNITGIAASEDVEVHMWGYSGGTIPTEWAAEIQPMYAPELKIQSAIIGGSITNVTSSILTINGGPYAGFIPSGMLGISKSYPFFANYLLSTVLPDKWANFTRPLVNCAEGDISDFVNQDIGNYFPNGLLDVLSSPDVQSVMKLGGQMGLQGLPQIPLYIYKAVGDDISPIADDDALVQSYCDSDIQSLVFQRNTYGVHLTNFFTGLGGALSYLEDRFNGIPAPHGCFISTSTIMTSDLSAFGDYSSQVNGMVEELLNLPIGPSSVV